MKRLLSTPEGFFAFVGLISGLLLIAIVPPFQTPDANVHFYRAYEVSELKTPRVGPGLQGGSYLPSSIRQTEIGVHGTIGPYGSPNQLAFNPDQKYDLHRTKAALSIPLNESATMFYITSGSPNYMPLNYFPQAITVSLGRLFNAPVIVLLYMVALVNLLIWISLAYVGIKIFPWKKWALVAVCLLPMMVLQSTSYGLDGEIFGASLIFLAVILRSVAEREHRIGYMSIVMLLLAAILMVFGKSVLVVFLPLVFLINDKQLLVTHPRLIKTLIPSLPIILYIAWLMFSITAASPTDSLNGALQFNVFIHSPWVFFGQLFNTLFLSIPEGYILVNSLIGYFGWVDTPLPSIFMIFGYVALIMAFLINYESLGRFKELSKKYRLVFLAVGLLYGGAVFLSMYIFFTTPSGNFVRGVQGRYLIPLLFIAIPLLFTDTLRATKRKYMKFIKISTLILLAISVLTIIVRYYVDFVPKL